MESTQIQALYEPPPAAMPQLSEKPRQGFETRKTAGKPGSNSCNFTVTLGLQATVVENGVRGTYSARYYNPNTGRFVSLDPKEHSPYEFGRKPLNPARLHKYLYAGGDPVNRIDPTGRADEAEYEGVTAKDLTQSARFVAQTQKLELDAVRAAIEALKQANTFAGNPDVWINPVTMDVYLEEADAFEYLDNLGFYL